MDFSSLVCIEIEKQKRFKEMLEQEKLARQEQERQEMIALIKKELSHILDDQWSVECVTIYTPLAYSQIFLSEEKREFRLSLLRDANKQKGYYVPRLEEVDQFGSKFLVCQGDWKESSKLTKKALVDFACEEICLYLNIK